MKRRVVRQRVSAARLAQVGAGICLAIALGSVGPAYAQSDNSAAGPTDAKDGLPSSIELAPAGKAVSTEGGKTGALSQISLGSGTATAQVDDPPLTVSPASLDSQYGYKGWDIPFPSFGDSLLQDYGGWRSTMAKAGFAFEATNVTIFQANVLNTPRRVPSSYPACAAAGGLCAGNRAYFGERPDVYDGSIAYLTYDTSRWGIPDGQIAIAGTLAGDTDQAYFPAVFQLSALSWYQTLLNKRLEIKVGYFSNQTEFAGTFVGNNIASPFGPSASIPVELGQSVPPLTSPSARVTWHIDQNFYDQFGIQRSLPVNGPTGNSLYDEAKDNGTGFDFLSHVHGTRALYVDEFGFRQNPLPGQAQTWIRLGGMYNSSQFHDLSKLGSDPTAVSNGNSAVYFLADRQLWQQAPASPLTAYRGIYAGISVMYAPPDETAFSQYYEGRVYWIGPLVARPTDMISFVYNHNGISSYLSKATNAYSALTGVYARESTNTVTISYLAHLIPGLYASVGVAYTDHPSLTYFPTEGHSLNALSSLFAVF